MIRKIEKTEIKKAVDMFLDSLKSQGKANSTIKEYTRVLERLITFLATSNINYIDEVSHLTVDNFLSHCETNYRLQYKTKYKYYAFLSNFFNYIYNFNMIGQIPTNRLVMKRPATKETFFYLNYDEIQRIINVARGQENRLRALTDAAFITFLAETGARRSDVLAMTWNRVKLNKRKVDICISKNKKEISVPMSDNLYNALLELKSYNRPNPYDPIFLSNKMEQISATTINTYFKKYVETSSVIEDRISQIENSDMPEEQKREAIERVEVTFHTLRHSFITRCFLEGKTVEEISDLTGNTDIDTLMKYKSMLETDYTAVANSLDSFREERRA